MFKNICSLKTTLQRLYNSTKVTVQFSVTVFVCQKLNSFHRCCQQVNVSEACCRVSETLLQFLSLMECCPEEEFTMDASPLHLSQLSAIAVSSNKSSFVQEVKQEIQVCALKPVSNTFRCLAFHYAYQVKGSLYEISRRHWQKMILRVPSSSRGGVTQCVKMAPQT